MSTISSPVSVQVVPGGPVSGTIRPPGSKSLTNRALVCAAFANGPSLLSGALRSEDTEVMIEALRIIGVQIEMTDGGRSLRVSRREGIAIGKNESNRLFIANSGTTIRFLTAALSAYGGNHHLHGVPRMHERPIADLITAIKPIQKGTIDAISNNGCPPVEILSTGWNDNDITVAGSVSSQYLSGLMMASPIAGKQRSIRVVGELVSRPYVDMTARVIESFGGQVSITSDRPDTEKLGEHESARVDLGDATYRGTTYSIEPDASAASYFWAAAAITGGKVTVDGLTPNAMQGDVGFCDVMRKMGCVVEIGDDSMTVVGKPLRGIDVDMNAISDTVQTLSVVALFADGPTRVRGVAHNRFKETDRIGDLAIELRKLGATVDEHEDGMTITPPTNGVRPATLETYHDHRMAMSLSLAGLVADGVRVLDPSCTGKTYPEYFADLEKLIGRPHRWASGSQQDPS